MLFWLLYSEKKPWTTDLANYRLQMSDVTINDLVIVMFIIKSQDY